MRDRGILTVRQLAQSGYLTWVLRGQYLIPRLECPESLKATMWEDKITILAILDRASAFRACLVVPSADPFPRMREGIRRGCPSCGREVARDEFRCSLCTLAIELALAAPGAPKETTCYPMPMHPARGSG
jgi:hypothetical protein